MGMHACMPAQQYNLRKQTEHMLKSMVMDSRTISVMDPEKYAARFCKAAEDLFVVRDEADVCTRKGRRERGV